MNHILLFGAGKSATVLIHYLMQLSAEKNWMVTIADSNATLLSEKVIPNELIHSEIINIEDTQDRQALIEQATVVISMMPPSLHYLIATDCIALKKHLLTASYIDEKIKANAATIKENNLLFLCEMGLDPGIDHMSAMKLIDEIHAKGGIITSFKSHCGGLIAPESDNNPWHYKISWNPRNIILAGKAGATYRSEQKNISVTYEDLFNTKNIIETPNGINYAYYANRDSLSYIPLYGLEQTHEFLRTTLRHPEFVLGWKNIIDLKLTNEEAVYETNGMTIAEFFKVHFKKYGFEQWIAELIDKKLSLTHQMMEEITNWMKVEEQASEVGETVNEEFLSVDEQGNLNSSNINVSAANLANNIHEVNVSLQQLFFLGLEDETLINKGLCSAADILQMILEKKLSLEPSDKDLVVMMHEIEYTLNNQPHKITSTLELKGENSKLTAMAKTVGLPLGIVAKLIVENKINSTGLHIPTIKEIYKPVLEALKLEGIEFIEQEH
jgi:saccharopine dehydrogenase-like NADP-dependent oxidoreductase